MNGYCFYFASMLKVAFNRGEIYIVAPFGHVVWRDTDDRYYDIDGEYIGAVDAMIPVTDPFCAIKDFKHLGKNDHLGASKKQIEFLINKYGDYEAYPSYYAGDYYMTQREDGLDIPYELDGTDRPFKFCVRLVKGKEAEAKELTDLLKGYEENIVYKYTEHSYVELSNFVCSIAVPKLNELGISPNSYAADIGSDKVVISVFEADYEEAFSAIESLVAEYGIAVELYVSECAVHD